MTNTKRYPATVDGLARVTPGVVRTRLRVFHLIAGALLGAYPYLPDFPGRGPLRWFLMIVVVPAITASGFWLWKQAAVRRWLRARGDRRS